jgi:hypothetical protein
VIEDKMFWLVWCPTGAKSPSHRHETEQSAIDEAERLARCAPNAKFYVLKATNVRFIDAMQRVILLDHNEIHEIPF